MKKVELNLNTFFLYFIKFSININTFIKHVQGMNGTRVCSYGASFITSLKLSCFLLMGLVPRGSIPQGRLGIVSINSKRICYGKDFGVLCNYCLLGEGHYLDK